MHQNPGEGEPGRGEAGKRGPSGSAVDGAVGVAQAGRRRPVRRAMISAQIEIAVSSGVRAPMSSPIGAMTRARPASVDAPRPQPLDALGVRACGCPWRRCSRRRCAARPTMAGTSNLWSWVSTQTASRGPSEAPTALEQPVGPVDDDLVGIGEPAPGGEHLAGVAHRDAVAEHLGHPDQRGGEVDGAEDQHVRRRGERLDEHRHRVLAGLAVRAVVADRRACRPPSSPSGVAGRRPGRGRRRRACRSALDRADQQLGARGAGPSMTVARATGSARSQRLVERRRRSIVAVTSRAAR